MGWMARVDGGKEAVEVVAAVEEEEDVRLDELVLISGVGETEGTGMEGDGDGRADDANVTDLLAVDACCCCGGGTEGWMS